MKKYLWRNVFWCIIIFVLCAMPGDKLPKDGFEIPHLDKIVHFGLFYIMGIFLCAELKYQTSLTYRKIGIWVIALVAMYGGLIELLQNYIFINRSGDYLDLLADISGGIAAVLMFRTLKTYKDRIVNKAPFNKYPILKKIL